MTHFHKADLAYSVGSRMQARQSHCWGGRSLLLVRRLFMRSSCASVRTGVIGVYMITSPSPSGCVIGGVPGCL